jgi:regulator of protease activity HflC (stomatin/prohibitin superfamily)
MLFPILFVILVILIAAVTLTAMAVILREYERAVVFTLGHFQKVKGPGLVMLVPFVQEMVRVALRIRVSEIPTQDGISRDNHAEVKFQASQTMVNAAKILGRIPGAMQLRYLQT